MTELYGNLSTNQMQILFLKTFRGYMLKTNVFPVVTEKLIFVKSRAISFKEDMDLTNE